MSILEKSTLSERPFMGIFWHTFWSKDISPLWLESFPLAESQFSRGNVWCIFTLIGINQRKFYIVWSTYAWDGINTCRVLLINLCSCLVKEQEYWKKSEAKLFCLVRMCFGNAVCKYYHRNAAVNLRIFHQRMKSDIYFGCFTMNNTKVIFLLKKHPQSTDLK